MNAVVEEARKAADTFEWAADRGVVWTMTPEEYAPLLRAVRDLDEHDFPDMKRELGVRS